MNDKKLLSEQVYKILLNKILSGEFPMGTIINRRDIANEFNVSVAPILEAMLKLEIDGLVETLPRKGTRVALITKESISDNLLIREALETMAIRIVCSNSDKTLLKSLLPLAQKLDNCDYGNSYYSADKDFHCALVSLTNNIGLIKEYERISNISFFYNMNMTISEFDTVKSSNHVQLLEDLINADENKAQELIHSHIVAGKPRLIITI